MKIVFIIALIAFANSAHVSKSSGNGTNELFESFNEISTNGRQNQVMPNPTDMILDQIKVALVNHLDGIVTALGHIFETFKQLIGNMFTGKVLIYNTLIMKTIHKSFNSLFQFPASYSNSIDRHDQYEEAFVVPMTGIKIMYGDLYTIERVAVEAMEAASAWRTRLAAQAGAFNKEETEFKEL